MATPPFQPSSTTAATPTKVDDSNKRDAHRVIPKLFPESLHIPESLLLLPLIPDSLARGACEWWQYTTVNKKSMALPSSAQSRPIPTPTESWWQSLHVLLLYDHTRTQEGIQFHPLSRTKWAPNHMECDNNQQSPNHHPPPLLLKEQQGSIDKGAYLVSWWWQSICAYKSHDFQSWHHQIRRMRWMEWRGLSPTSCHDILVSLHRRKAERKASRQTTGQGIIRENKMLLAGWIVGDSVHQMP